MQFTSSLAPLTLYDSIRPWPLWSCKLAEASLTYLQLVDATRMDLALRYIDDATRSISDITFSLGFSQPSAFTRAFKRWTGSSPTDYRASHTAGKAG